MFSWTSPYRDPPPLKMFKHVQLDLSIQGPPTSGNVQTCSVGPLHIMTPHLWKCSNMFSWTSPYREPNPWKFSNLFSWTSPYREPQPRHVLTVVQLDLSWTHTGNLQPIDMFQHVQLDLSIQATPTHRHVPNCSVGPLHIGTPHLWKCSNMFSWISPYREPNPWKFSNLFSWTSPYRDPPPLKMFKLVQLDLSIQKAPAQTCSNMFSWTSPYREPPPQTYSNMFSWTSPYRETPPMDMFKCSLCSQGLVGIRLKWLLA